MKWIYSMVGDDTYRAFKLFYETAKEKNVDEFGWNGEIIKTKFAGYVCNYVDNHVAPEYEESLIARVEEHHEWMFDVNRGK